MKDMSELEKKAIRIYGYIEINRIYITETKAFQLVKYSLK